MTTPSSLYPNLETQPLRAQVQNGFFSSTATSSTAVMDQQGNGAPAKPKVINPTTPSVQS
jgi:hypothetical protein